MKLLIDADGCPVVKLSISIAQQFGVPVTLFCDTAHMFDLPGTEVVVVSKGADSADFALVNRAAPGDIVVTQDFGLAAMCLSRGARVLRQDGMPYTQDNIDSLLMARYTAAKVRRGGGRLRGQKKRSAADNDSFAAALRVMLEQTSQP